MKKLAIIAAALLMGVASYAQSAKSIYNKYSEEPKVSAVYVSPAMFRLMGSIPEISMPDGNIDLGPIIKDMQGMCMALWELRTGAQDGSSDVSKVKRITKDKEWYVVYYVDMGMEGATKLKVAVIKGKILVSDYKRVSLGSTSNL